MDDIDIKHNLLKAYFYKSPFYNYYCKFCVFKDPLSKDYNCKSTGFYICCYIFKGI